VNSAATISKKLIAGAASGVIAPIPMTVAMIAINKLMRWPHRQRLEPRKITDDMLRRAGLRHQLSEEERKQAAVAAHFAFGCAAGSIYPIVEPFIPAPRTLRGPLYGLAVWAVSYSGVLPAIGSLPPQKRRPAGRALLLAASHVVWGAALQLASDSLDRHVDGRSRR
jgi:uncharacterized membrane protein YagU involved in acid resistance